VLAAMSRCTARGCRALHRPISIYEMAYLVQERILKGAWEPGLSGARGSGVPKLQLLLIGPSPPPYNGMTTATQLVLKALGSESIRCIHLDTADRRGLSNVGKFDLGNLTLAAKHGIEFVWLMLTRRPRAVYVPIAQAWLPFLRDCLFLIPARLLRRKVVIHLHGGYFGRFYRQTSPVMRWIIRYALGRTACAIVLGRNVADAFDGILPHERIRIVPNGIPDPFVGRTLDASKDAEARPPILLFLSTLKAQKGFLDLLRALPKAREGAGKVRAVFAGEWYGEGVRQTADRLIESLGLREIVEFVGPVGPERKHELLESADILVLPTYNEGHPYVILEAMSAALPIVSTSVACIPETVRDGVEGLLVEPGDIQALADRIGRLLSDASLRKRMGEASRQRFLEEYTYDQFWGKMKAVFAEILESEGDAEPIAMIGESR
jgi:glycosyltransferase involved in cell wall biosynthesis